MSDANSMMMYLTIYKAAMGLVGLGFAFMGYRLFIHGIFAQAGELATHWNDRGLILRKAAPGTFFAMFGTIVVCVSLWQGLTFGSKQGETMHHGSGMFGQNVPAPDNRDGETTNSAAARQPVLDDIAILNRFANELERHRDRNEANSAARNDGDQMLDLIDRTKAMLMASVWSRDWGDPKEFRKWAKGSDGYYYGDPPAGITRAVSIYKGEAQ